MRMGMLLVLVLALSSCARHVTIDPDQVQKMNSPDWKIEHEPEPPAKPAAPVPPRH